MKRKCKVCNKPLLKKQKLFCHSCWSKITDNGKTGLQVFGTVVSVLALAYFNKDKIEDFFQR